MRGSAPARGTAGSAVLVADVAAEGGIEVVAARAEVELGAGLCKLEVMGVEVMGVGVASGEDKADETGEAEAMLTAGGPALHPAKARQVRAPATAVVSAVVPPRMVGLRSLRPGCPGLPR